MVLIEVSWELIQWQYLLERLDLQDYDDGLDGLLRDAGAAARDLLLQEPYWLQVRANMIF